jgi:hypothetical protein
VARGGELYRSPLCRLCCECTHLDHNATGRVTVEAEGSGASPLQDGGHGGLEACTYDAGMMLLYLLHYRSDSMPNQSMPGG